MCLPARMSPWQIPALMVNQLYPVGGRHHPLCAGRARGAPLEGQGGYYKVAVDGLSACMELFEELKKGGDTGAAFLR